MREKYGVGGGSRRAVRRWLAIRLLFLALPLCILPGAVQSGVERYDYDPLGRLIRVVDENNRATEYTYDAVGNLLQVNTGATASAPAITSIAPASLRRGETKAFTIVGSAFAGSSLTLSDPSLDLSGVKISATQIGFNLTAPLTTSVGGKTLTVKSSAGTAATTISVAPVLPTVGVDPVPLAVPPDGVARQFSLRLSNTDTINHTIALSASNSNVRVSPASITIPAGQISAAASITGLIAGQATIGLSSATLGESRVPVFVTAEFVGISTSYAPYLGVVLKGASQPVSTAISPITNRPLGVVLGSAIRGISPAGLAPGAGPVTLNVSGIGLQGAQSLAVVPSTGLTVGTPTVAADGATVSVPVTVAPDASLGLRRVVIKNAAGVAYPAWPLDANTFSIVRLPPTVDSIAPLFATPDSTVTMTIRGSNLQDVQRVGFTPPAGIQVDASPLVSSDGTSMTLGMRIPASTPIGNYVVTVTTPGGSSSAVASVNNTFGVVGQIQQTISPIMAPPLGIVLQGSGSAQQSLGLVSTPLGVALGPVATALSPDVGIVGQSTTLSVQGGGLAGVTAVGIIPGTGLTVGSPVPAADGKSVTVPITIAADAPTIPRLVKLTAGPAAVPFSPSVAAKFLISLPLPQIDSISPIVLQTGQAPVAFTINGRNFHNASQIKVYPPEGITVSAPVVNTNGTQAVANLLAAATAVVGSRVVTIVTPAGESSATPLPSNTLTLSPSAGSSISPLLAPLLGVVLGEVQHTATTGLVASPLLGLVLQAEPAPPASRTASSFATNLGVALGPIATAIDGPTGFAPGAVGTLTVRGYQLGGVTAVGINPSSGITLGVPSVSVDGRQVTVSIAVDPAAARGPYALQLKTANGVIPFAEPRKAQLRVGPGVPELDSITPILAEQGDAVTMTIRGRNFQDATAVTANPDSGITIDPSPVVNADGSVITVGIRIDSSAPLGSRAIQVVVPGAASDPAPVPANTLTVYAP